jgi:hypothetical protein
MKKFSVLIALVLLAVAGTGFAVTCAYDNVPAATLLVPHFRVGRNGSTGADIPLNGIDTLCAITNVSGTGIIVHATLWNKYSKAVLDFNIPMTGYDVAWFSMKGVLNGQLNVNTNLQKVGSPDPCSASASFGFGQTIYRKFNNPNAADLAVTVGIYGVPAFSGPFRQRVWDSLDETGDITSLTSPNGDNILDADNRACGTTIDAAYTGDFGGYVTFDVVNYCTNYFPDEPNFYVYDAIATAGWPAGVGSSPATSLPGYSPNTIIGDIFYIDPTADGGNISADQMVPIEFDTRLQWTPLWTSTFFGRYTSVIEDGTVGGAFAPAVYQFLGDGREQLGNRYGFRYLADAASGQRSWAIVWRSDLYNNPAGPTNLCEWYNTGDGGLADLPHALTLTTRNNDESSTVVSGGPSGDTTTTTLFIYLESQRIDIFNSSSVNPGAYTGGWIDVQFNSPATGQNQSYVGIQHSGAGLAVSVGHSAALLSNQFTCQNAAFTFTGNTVDTVVP